MSQTTGNGRFQSQDEIIIRVRDRRKARQFSIDNLIMDEWFPVITLRGFTLYSFYCRMANGKDERCFPGYSLIRTHLGMGKTSISDYNKLLTWCGLIHIQSGNENKSNDYYILDVPKATPERINAIKEKAEAELNGDSKFLTQVLKRLESWQPLRAHWKEGTKQIVVVHPNQLSLFPNDQGGSPPAEPGSPSAEPGSPMAKPGSPPAEPGVRPEDSNNPKATKQSNDPKQQSEAVVANGAETAVSLATATPSPELEEILRATGIRGKKLAQLLAAPHVTIPYAQAHIRAAERDGIKTGLLIHRMLENDPTPACDCGQCPECQQRWHDQAIPNNLQHIIVR